MHVYARALETAASTSSVAATVGHPQQQHPHREDNQHQQQQESTVAHFIQLAEHFRLDGDILNAGKFFGMAKQYKQVSCFLIKIIIFP
jgi:hypothetical protein